MLCACVCLLPLNFFVRRNPSSLLVHYDFSICEKWIISVLDMCLFCPSAFYSLIDPIWQKKLFSISLSLSCTRCVVRNGRVGTFYKTIFLFLAMNFLRFQYIAKRLKKKQRIEKLGIPVIAVEFATLFSPQSVSSCSLEFAQSILFPVLKPESDFFFLFYIHPLLFPCSFGGFFPPPYSLVKMYRYFQHQITSNLAPVSKRPQVAFECFFFFISLSFSLW